MEKEKHFIYSDNKFSNEKLNIKLYNESYFEQELALESDAFYEIRKLNDIKPYKINDSTEIEKDKIRKYFNNNKNNFYLLIENEKLIGSALIIDNYIKVMCIISEYQNKGYGTKLIKYIVNKILEKGYKTVKLDVLPGNNNAEKIYKKLNFREQ